MAEEIIEKKAPEIDFPEVAPYRAVCAQFVGEYYNPDLYNKFPAGLKERNLKRTCDWIDNACSRSFPLSFMIPPIPVRLIAFPEFSIGGYWSAKTTTKEIQEYCAISIPGPETDKLAEKAKQYNLYIAAANYENDPAYPDWCFNTGFIINPEGKIILKYRKIQTSSQPIEWGCSPHDVLDKYKNPITGIYDPFPVVDTEIGRLGMMICGDLSLPEIPRVYAMKGCEVLIRVTAAYLHELAQWMLRSHAKWNIMYIVSENYAATGLYAEEIGGQRVITMTEPSGGGGSAIYDYTGNVALGLRGPAQAVDNTPQLVDGVVDIMALRQARTEYGIGFLSACRTELYAPYYAKTIYPPNRFLEVGPIGSLLDEKQTETYRIAMENLKKLQDWYSEKDVK